MVVTMSVITKFVVTAVTGVSTAYPGNKRTQLDKREFHTPKKDVFRHPFSFEYKDFLKWNTLFILFL